MPCAGSGEHCTADTHTHTQTHIHVYIYTYTHTHTHTHTQTHDVYTYMCVGRARATREGTGVHGISQSTCPMSHITRLISHMRSHRSHIRWRTSSVWRRGVLDSTCPVDGTELHARPADVRAGPRAGHDHPCGGGEASPRVQGRMHACRMPSPSTVAPARRPWAARRAPRRCTPERRWLQASSRRW